MVHEKCVRRRLCEHAHLDVWKRHDELGRLARAQGAFRKGQRACNHAHVQDPFTVALALVLEPHLHAPPRDAQQGGERVLDVPIGVGRESSRQSIYNQDS